MNHSIGAAGRVAVAGGSGLVVGAGYLAPLLAAPSLRGISTAVLLGLCAAAGVFLWRSAGRLGALVAVPAILAALLVAMSVPLAKDGYPEVSITATGQKNPASKSSEVFVRLVSEPVQGLRDFDGEGWEKRGDVFVSYQKQPSVLHYRGAWSSGAALRIVRHAYSGIAEVSISGKTQRLDLFSEKEAFVDVPLPEASVSWKGYVQRAVVAVGLGVFFTAAGMALAGASAAWGGVFALALLAGCGSLWLVKDRSYAGLMEVVAFAASSEPVRVEMDAGHGFTPALVVPVKGGAAVATEFAVPNPAAWKLGIEGGGLRVFRELDAVAAGDASSGNDNGCAIVATGRCVYEVQGAGPLRVWLQAGAEQKALMLPAAAAGSERLFLLVEREAGRIEVSASRAFVQLSPWEHFSQWVVALRVVGQDGKAAGKLVRVVSEGIGSYRVLAPGAAEGEFRVPSVPRGDTGSVTGMKVFSVLIGVGSALLLAAAVKIGSLLVRCYRDGRRLQVLASVLGGFGWLGLALVIGWPAVIGWDGLSPYIQAQTGEIMLWYGIGYPLIVGGFLQLGSGALVTAWSAALVLVLVLGVAAGLLRVGGKQAANLPPIMLVALLPFTAIAIGMLTHLRDAMNGLLLATFAVASFWTSLRWGGWHGTERWVSLLGLLLLGAVLALLRVDNLPTLAILLLGMGLYSGGVSLRSLAGIVFVGACWLGIGPTVEQYVFPNRVAAMEEKRTYEVTALINPLMGMLVNGEGRISEAQRTQIRSVLDTVMDVAAAEKQWTPYNIIYWHESYQQRPRPTPETLDALRKTFVSSILTNPSLFLQLRLATFSATLGHTWFYPGGPQDPAGERLGKVVFPDHLQSDNPHWIRLSELHGFVSNAHALPEQVKWLREWSGKMASNVLPLIVCIVVALRFRRSPLAAVVAVGEIVRAGVFFLLAPASVFLYLYDMHLLGFLLPMMALTEQAVRAGGRTGEGAR
jgi:hypothetical protein